MMKNNFNIFLELLVHCALNVTQISLNRGYEATILGVITMSRDSLLNEDNL